LAAGGTLYTFGNGGSSTDAAAVAGCFSAAGLAAVCLVGDQAAGTALANDIGFESAAARHLAALGRPGDVFLGLSTSGSSENLLRAFDVARDRGMTTVGFAGHDGGLMATAGTVDHLFVVPSPSVHRIQEAQTTLYQVLADLTVTAHTWRPALGSARSGDAVVTGKT
jgi:D-sedoheptulose 7-phosphate isomerase